jgi:hypothetical protein
MTKENEDKIKSLFRRYFTTLVHYQYDINNDVPNAIEEFNREELYQLGLALDGITQILSAEGKKVKDLESE